MKFKSALIALALFTIPVPVVAQSLILGRYVVGYGYGYDRKGDKACAKDAAHFLFWEHGRPTPYPQNQPHHYVDFGDSRKPCYALERRI